MTKRKSLLVVAAVALPILIIGGAIGWFLWSFDRAVRDTTDARQYPAILSKLGYPTPTQLSVPSLAHLPAAIPSTATNVRFYYRPHFLQGGTQLQLRMVLPPAEVAAALQSAKSAAREIQTGGSDFDAINHNKGLLRSASFRDAANTTFAPLPEDFQVFILDAKDQSPPTWNHGYSYGIAINDKLSEVIYWVEDW